MTILKFGKALKGHSILVLEDESMVYLMIEDLLTELDCKVRRASSVEAACTLLDAYQPELAILDVNIAGKSCTPVAERLESMGVPFIFSTGYGRDAATAAYSASPVIQKPFALADLAAALEAALGQAAEPPSRVRAKGSR